MLYMQAGGRFAIMPSWPHTALFRVACHCSSHALLVRSLVQSQLLVSLSLRTLVGASLTTSPRTITVSLAALGRRTLMATLPRIPRLADLLIGGRNVQRITVLSQLVRLANRHPERQQQQQQP